MPTAKQIEAMNLYCAMMEEIKVRIQFIETAITGKLFIQSRLVRESSYLQLRLICEMIALACLIANGDIKPTKQKRLTKEWDASKIIDGLGSLHPDFYPRPVTHERVGPKAMHLTALSSGFLTKDELVSLYGRSGDFLHRGSLKKLLKKNATIETSYSDVWEWLRKIGTLLSLHQVRLADGNTFYLCALVAQDAGGRCQVAIAESPAPPPPADVLKAFENVRSQS